MANALDVSERARQRLADVHEQFKRDNPEYAISQSACIDAVPKHVISRPRYKLKRSFSSEGAFERAVRLRVIEVLRELDSISRLCEWKRELRQIRSQYGIPSETVSAYSREYIEVDLMCRLDPLGEL